jgi:hypothetical protein
MKLFLVVAAPPLAVPAGRGGGYDRVTSACPDYSKAVVSGG